MLSIFVTINVMEEYLGEFMSASLADSEGSVCNEPSCYRFDIHQDEAIPTRFYLYEVYSDEEAFQYHLTTPHFLAWKEQVDGNELERCLTNFAVDVQHPLRSRCRIRRDNWRLEQ